jgi:hypothetical protein
MFKHVGVAALHNGYEIAAGNATQPSSLVSLVTDAPPKSSAGLIKILNPEIAGIVIDRRAAVQLAVLLAAAEVPVGLLLREQLYEDVPSLAQSVALVASSMSPRPVSASAARRLSVAGPISLDAAGELFAVARWPACCFRQIKSPPTFPAAAGR